MAPLISDESSLSPSLFVFSAKDDLEREPLLRGRSVLLERVDYHAYWVSNEILSKLNSLPDEVDGGLIVRDKAGKPTGPSDFSLIGHIFPTLRSGVFVDNAMNLIEKPAPTEAEILERFETAMLDALRAGLTSIHDAEASPDSIAFFRQYVPLQIYLHF